MLLEGQKKLVKISWKLLILGIVVAAMLQPFNVMISAHEGLLDGNYIVVNKYFYQLTILISGFGSSFAYFLNYKVPSFKKISITLISIIPFLIFSIVTFMFDIWFPQNVFPKEVIYILIQLMIMTWYFLQGGLLTVFLQELKSVKYGWLSHVLGLLIGYLLAYYYLNNYGILGIIVFCFVLLLLTFKSDKKFIVVGIILVSLIPYFEGLFNSFIINKMTSVIYEDSQDEYYKDKKRSFKRHYLKEDSKIIYYKLGLRGLTEVIQNSNYKASVYVNKYHTFSYIDTDMTNFDRAAIYNELFTAQNEKAIIGFGGGRSLYYVDENKIKGLNAIEINKDTIDFALSYKSALQDKLKKINYLNLDGRFYIDTLKNDSLDVAVYEGATLQAQAFQSVYLKPNFLSNSDSITSTSQKLKKDGFLVFERTQMVFGLKVFQYNLVMLTLKNLGFSFRALVNPKLKNFYIIANREVSKLSVVDQILKKSGDLMEVPSENFMAVSLKKMSQCPVTYNDNHPYISVFCKSSLIFLGNTPIYVAFYVFCLTLICSIFFLRKFSNDETSIATLFITQGLLQSLAFSFLQFKFESYLWDDNFTLFYLISFGLIFSFLGNLFFLKQKKSLSFFLVFCFLFLALLLILPHLNIYGIISIKLRFLIITLSILVFNFFIGGIFSNMLTIIKTEMLGRMLFWDSVGLFLGYLSNYFALRTFGLSSFSIYISFFFMIFLFMILRFKKQLFLL